MTHLPNPLALALALLLVLTSAATAGLGEGITTGRLTLRPYVSASINYDSNALRTTSDEPVEVPEEEVEEPVEGEEEEEPEEQVSDYYYELRGGVNFLWFGEETVLSGSAWAYARTYAEQDTEDNEGFGERLGLLGGDREKLSWSLFQSFERRSDFLLTSPEPVNADAGLELTPPNTVPGDTIDLEEELIRTQSERDLLNFGVDVGRDLTEKIELDAGYVYSDVEYVNPSLFDYSAQQGTVSLGYKFSYKTTAFISGSYGLNDNEAFIDPVSNNRILLGLRSSSSPKLSYNIGFGYTSSETADYAPRELEDGTIVYEDGSRTLPDGTFEEALPRLNPVTGEIIEEVERDEDLSGLAYDAGITWRPTEKLSFSLTGRNGYDSNSNGRQRKTNLLQLSGRHQTTEAISTSLRISYRDEEDPDQVVLVDEIDGTERRLNPNREYLTAGARIGYRPPGKWYEFYADASYEDIQSNIQNQSYDRYRLGAGVRATY